MPSIVATLSSNRGTILRALLNDLPHRQSDVVAGSVFALTGPWGCGKTHLWRELCSQLEKTHPERRVLYASLFGVESLTELRSLLFTEAFVSDEEPTTRTAAFWSKAKSTFFNGMPILARVLDNKLGGPFLAKLVDPTGLLAGSIICLDDLERAPESLKLSTVLGFANVLAERHHMRVLVIYNDEHVSERRGFGELGTAYRERVVERIYRLHADVPAIAQTLPDRNWPQLAATDRGFVAEFLNGARVTNLRTLIRSLDRAHELRQHLTESTIRPVLAFLIALTCEQGAGTLREESFYNFNPVMFLFFDKTTPPTQETSERIEFHQMYYGVGRPEYRYSRAIYEYVRDGALDSAQLQAELAPDPIAESEAQAHLSFYHNEDLKYFSDAEHEVWATTAARLLNNETLSALDAFQLYLGIRLSCAQRGLTIPPDVVSQVRQSLASAARAQDKSLDPTAYRFTKDSGTVELLETYTSALDGASRQERASAFMEAIWTGSFDEVRKLLRDDPDDGVRIILGAPVLDELHARRSQRRLYFDTLLHVAQLIRDRGLVECRPLLRDYLASIRREHWDAADLHRLDVVARVE